MIIDMHVHLTDSKPLSNWASEQWPGTREFVHTSEQFIQKMDTCDPQIDKALVFSFNSLHSESPQSMRKENDYISTSASNSERLIGACLIDPSWDDQAILELNRMVKTGIRVVKIKFSSVQVPANSPLAIKIFNEIDDLGILPVLHSDWSYWTNPSIIGDLMQNFPDMKIVMQHFGLTQSDEALNVAKNNPNIYVDTSAVIHPRNILRFISEINEKRLMFASDTIKGYEKTMPQEEMDRVKKLDLPEPVLANVLGRNAQNLLQSVGVQL
jgi:predicted TIM-barrel fold metal-dependent hydrolase